MHKYGRIVPIGSESNGKVRVKQQTGLFERFSVRMSREHDDNDTTINFQQPLHTSLPLRIVLGLLARRYVDDSDEPVAIDEGSCEGRSATAARGYCSGRSAAR